MYQRFLFVLFCPLGSQSTALAQNARIADLLVGRLTTIDLATELVGDFDFEVRS